MARERAGVANALVRAAILARGRTIRPDGLAETTEASASPSTAPGGNLNLHAAIAQTERHVIGRALSQANWNRTQAAVLLGISRRQLFDKIRRHGLHP